MTEETSPQEQDRLVTRSIQVLNVAGYRCARLHGEFGEFDLIGLTTTSVILVRVCHQIPFRRYVDELKAIPVTANTVKALHVWKPRCPLPEYLEL